MKRSQFLRAFGLFWLVSVMAWAEEKPTVLFDGKSLDQWSSLGSAKWRAEDGILVTGQDGDPKRSGLLSTKETFQDFDIELEFMIDEHGKYNSGVYLRNTPGQRGRTGYQINIGRGAADEPVGLFLNDWLDKGDAEDKIRKPLAWNHLRIRARGAHIETWLNKEKIVDYTDPSPKEELLQPGTIALQTYGAEGHDGWVKFRHITIRKL
ncbi:MAG: hypothetical protein ACI8T1_000525 [Verrucomicrobiales bacterium]|jgi:hypothetical protein